MKKPGIALLGVGALVGLTGITLAQGPADRDAASQRISDRELFEAASPVTVLDERAVTAGGNAVLTQGVKPLGEGEAMEGLEGPDLDGPGGSTLEFQGEQTGDH